MAGGVGVTLGGSFKTPRINGSGIRLSVHPARPCKKGSAVSVDSLRGRAGQRQHHP